MSWATRPVALALAGLLMLTSSAEGVSGLPKPSAGRGGSAAADPAPGQRWDSGTGTSHVANGRVNRTLPKSLRGRYTQPALRQAPIVKSNPASVGRAPVRTVQGFHRATSRELPEARGAFERTYSNADGTQTTEFSGTPVNYRRADGLWAPIDPTLVGDARTGWRNSANVVDIRFAPRADSVTLARFTVDAQHVVSYGLAGAAASTGRVEGAVVTYPNVLPGVDVTLEARPGGVKETLVLRSADAPRSYVFPLTLDGLTAKVVDGQVVLSDMTGAPRAVFPAGYMVDSAPKVAMSTGVRYELVTHAGRQALRVTVDDAWLRAPGRVYPVLVDPTVSLPLASGSADSGMYVHGSGSASGSSDLLVGTVNGTNSASYIRFGSLVDRLRYHTIYGAKLQVVNYDSDSCKAREVSVHPVTAAWSSSGNYSYPGPSVGGALAARSFAHGHIAFGQTSSSCPTTAELFDLGGAGAKLVQRWVNGDQANYGLSLRASTDSLSGKKFTGTGTANPPKLFVTHSPYNATYSIPKPVPEPPVLQNQDGKVKVTVTNKSAQAWAPGDYYLAYRAYNAQTGAAVGQQRSANLTASVARGAKVTFDATIKAMAPGTYFLDFTMVRTGGVVFTDHQVPPARLVMEVVDIAPVVQELYPPNGYRPPTLTPQLWARALDIDAPPGSTLSFKFEVCESGTTTCFDSGYQAGTAWTVPAGKLVWSKTYLWRAFVKDAGNEVISPRSAMLTAVPQPEITSRVAGAPTAAKEREFDAQTGNFSTVAVDATATTIGPDLNVVRAYNSLDPRRDGAFGAGWSTRYDMRVTPDSDGSGNVVVTYADGQQVRFGRNTDGSYAAPPGRTASLTVDSTQWTLVDSSRSTYRFSLAGRLSRITDAAQRSVVLTYSTTDGKLSRAQVSTSQTNTAGRSLRFAWSGAHVSSVTTDAVNGTALTWTYSYTGDRLTQVCAPGSVCTAYEYAIGSHYRSAVADSRPESYWRLGEAQGTGAGSEIAVNLGKDAGIHQNVTLGTAGALAGTSDTAASFNGTSSFVELPKGLVKKSRDGAVELWFKASATGAGGPLLGYQDKALSATSTTGVPLLYVGTDGRLRGQFGGTPIAPIASTATVNDGRWHHAVLSAMGSTQTLYLDGVKVGEVTGRTLEHSLLTFNQIGAAYASTPGSWPAWGSTTRRYFTGAVDEVALYSHPLGAAAVAAHYAYGTAAADQLSKVTLPSGKVAAEVSYDTLADRVTEYTDRHGGSWQVGAPTVYGGDTDLRRSVQVLDPAGRPHLYEHDALTGQLLRSGTPLGLAVREEDLPGEPTPSPEPPVEACTAPDPTDPSFCTTIPGSAGGPVFVRHPLDGLAIRTFQYDDNGNQTVVTNENGDSVTMTHDGRGNVTSTKTCRTSTECYTTYTTYPTTVTDPLDPRNNLPTASRDGRSSSATDGTYLTSYTYTSTGEVATQTNPDGSVLRRTYTTGAEAAYGGGTMPAGLLLTTTDARGKVTRYAYFHNGDLARVTLPSGLITNYTYDSLGRIATRTEVSDTFPAGVTTTYAYDALSRLVSKTEPATTDSVSGDRHQRQRVYGYDADGNVVRLDDKDLLGGDTTRTTTWAYDEHNRPIRVTDAEGNETSYGYDRFGNKTSMVDRNGNRYDYAYTARNSLAEVRLRGYAGDDGPSTGDHLVLRSYTYDFAGRLASDTDAMGRRYEYQYFGDDQLRRIVLKGFRNADGTTRDYVVEESAYDGAGNLTRQAIGNGTTVNHYTYDRMSNPLTVVADPGGLTRTTTFAYDPGGNVTRVSNSGKASNVPWAMSTTPEAVSSAYDDAGNVIRQTVTAGTASRVTTYAYDQRGLPTAITEPRGNVTGADPAVYTTRLAYDELGRQTTVTAPAVAAERDGGAPTTVNPTSKVGYNTFGEQVREADQLGNVSHVTYDRLGRLASTTAPRYWAPGVPADYTATTQVRHDPNGNVVEVVDPRGNHTRATYDQLDRMTTRDGPGTTDDERAVWRYTYTRTGAVLSATDPTGARVEATYDDLDRQITTTRVERRPSAANLTTRYSYDDAGNITKSVSPTGATAVNVYDALGQLIRADSPSGVPTHFGYDHAGRQVRLSDSVGRTSQVTYDLFGQVATQSELAPNGTVLRTRRYGYDAAGNLTAVTRPDATQADGVTTTYAYDAMGRLIRQVEPATASTSITTTFGYDAAGNRTRYTDGRGNSTIYTYNSWSMPQTIVEPATAAHPDAAQRTWTLAYDVFGDLTRVTAPGGVTRQQAYDAAGRVAAEYGAGAGTPERTFGYDLAGRLTRVSAPTGGNTYTYDDRGNLIGSAGPSGTASFGYDGDGNRASRTDAAGTATYTYQNGRLASVQDGITGTTQRLTYDAAGAPSAVDFGSGRKRSLTYDDLGRVATDTTRNAANQTVASVAYRYDVADQVVGMTTTGIAGSGEHTYGYDLGGRLVSWTSPAGTVGYAWDNSGNRTRAGSKTATYDARNRLLSDSDYTYTYTPRGTLASRTSSGHTESFEFDAFDRMVTAAGQAYTYDGLDRVTARNGTSFSYAGLGDEVVADGEGRYARGPADEVVAVAQGDDELLTLANRHGDVIAGFEPTDTTLGGVPDSTAYDPFGQVVTRTGDTGNLGYQGDWTDPATDQVDMGARWYDPGTGAFNSRDSYGYASGASVFANRYTYGAASPLGYTDPDGHWPDSWIFTCDGYTFSVFCLGRTHSQLLYYLILQQAHAQERSAKGSKRSAAKPRVTYPSYAPGRAAKNGSGSCGACYGGSGLSARERAEAARRAEYEAKRRATQRARETNEYAAKNKPIPPSSAARRPSTAALKEVVSTSPHVPAKATGALRDVVHDTNKAAEKIYQSAVESAGNVVHNISAAANAATGGGGGTGGPGRIPSLSDYLDPANWPDIADQLLDPEAWLDAGAEVIGLNDLIDCANEGDLVACGWTVATVAGYVFGGAPGAAVRAARAGSVAARYGDDVADAARRTSDTVEAASCAVVKSNSFTGDTKVRMADGSTKPISEVNVGDKVLATDPTTGRTEAQPVTDVITGTGEKHLVDITVDTDADHGHAAEKIVATDGHPFWVDSEQRWVESGDIQAGQRIETSRGGTATVVATGQRTEQTTVYNLTVDRLHTYFVVVGDTDLLVHNADANCPVHGANGWPGNPRGCNCNGGGSRSDEGSALPQVGRHSDTAEEYHPTGSRPNKDSAPAEIVEQMKGVEATTNAPINPPLSGHNIGGVNVPTPELLIAYLMYIGKRSWDWWKKRRSR